MSRITRLPYAAQALAVFALWPAAVAEARVSFHGVVSAAGGVTDNASGSPAAGADAAQTDGFAEFSPGLVMAHETPRVVQQLSYRFSANLFAGETRANSYTHRLDWGAFFDLSRTSSVLLGLSTTQGKFNTLAAPAGMGGALPPTGVNYLATTFQEGITKDFSREWRGLQFLTIGAFIPLADDAAQGKGLNVDHRLGAERAYARDALGFEVRFGYSLYGGTTAAPERQQFDDAAVVRWRRELSRTLQSQLDVGVGMVMEPDFSGIVWLPVVNASLRYSRGAGQLALGYGHAVQGNVLVGQTFVVDSLSLHGSHPLGNTSFSVSAGVSGQHGRTADTANGALGSTTDTLGADAALSWAISDTWGMGLRYQVSHQTSDTDIMGVAPSFTRNVVLLTVSGVFPGQSGSGGLPYRAPLQLRSEREAADEEQAARSR